MTLVDKIRELANQRNMSLPDLETKVGLGNGTISRWKSSSPNTDKLTKVADELGVSVDYLLGREKLVSNDLDIRRIQRARQKMPVEDKDFMMQMLTRSLGQYFDEDGADDPD